MSADEVAQDENERHAPETPGRPSAAEREGVAPRCANCDIEIAWAPIVSSGLAYCCLGCAQGGPCSCDYSEHPNSLSGS